MKRSLMIIITAAVLSACASTSELKAPCKTVSLDAGSPCTPLPINVAAGEGAADAV